MTEGAATLHRPSRWRRAVKTAIPPLIVFGIILAVWYLTSYLQFPDERRRAAVQPPPDAVFRAGFLDERNREELLDALRQTAWVAIVGLICSIVIGVAVAILMSLSRTIERTLYPYAILLQTIPIVAISPLMIIWFGTGRMPRVLVCVIIAVFPIITNTLFGLKAADRGQIDLFTLHGAGRLKRLLKLDLPGAQPAMFTGFRISAGLAVIGAIVGEFFFKAGEEGLGRRIGQYTQRNEADRVMAAILLAAALGLVIFLFFGWLGNRATKHWRPDAGARR